MLFAAYIPVEQEVIYYVYMTSFALSRYHIWITCGLLLNVIC